MPETAERPAVLVFEDTGGIWVFDFPDLDAPEDPNPQPKAIYSRGQGWTLDTVAQSYYQQGYDVY